MKLESRGESVFDKAGKIIEQSGILNPRIDLPDWVPDLPGTNLPRIDVSRVRLLICQKSDGNWRLFQGDK
ncbi:hypothetical protein [Paenibacillus sp. OSY-SE]|uniref:hypothetical protein n=1 Tax=Paenibacillus sp. OSY-SE TaxID=1196323 RepID=UPI000360DC66|nr:hypothetical protein [Paenibacillus sp. OSY-SE]